MTRFARAKGSKASNERVPEEATSWLEMKQKVTEKKDELMEAAEKEKIEAARLQNYNEFLQDENKSTTQEWCEFSETENDNEKNNTQPKIKKGRIRKKSKKNSPEVAVKNNYVSLLPAHYNSNDSDEAPVEESVGKVDENFVPKKKQKMQMKNKPNTAVNTNKRENEPLFNKKGQLIKRKTAKIRDDKEHKSRKPNGCERILCNGVYIDIIKFDGFPVKKEDHERLTELRKSMIAKGIPRSEVKITMQKERRKAEKALAREKKSVCFRCRKSGHLLSECPEVGHNGPGVQTSGTGLCFKCGSTEHTQFECKVVHTQEFKFAECFICKEKGHIARQCPDNPRGLYPKGGGCRHCGSVAHLKHNCPQEQQAKEVKTITLPTSTTSVEGLETDEKPSPKKSMNTSQNIVKF